MNAEVVKARPASTVVLLRDGDSGLETLLLKRNKALMFAGGLWVFPGGSIDPEDLAAAGGDEREASRITAAREALEESGLQPKLDDMLQLSHWTTPIIEPKRFSTWIYAAPVASDEEVCIDGSEIHDSRWISIKAAVEGHESGDLGMMPPTYLTLRDLARYSTVAQMLAGEAMREPNEVLPVFSEADSEVVLMFRGDAGYDTADGSLPGARHRVILCGQFWHYVHSDVAAEHPSFIH